MVFAYWEGIITLNVNKVKLPRMQEHASRIAYCMSFTIMYCLYNVIAHTSECMRWV